MYTMILVVCLIFVSDERQRNERRGKHERIYKKTKRVKTFDRTRGIYRGSFGQNRAVDR